LLKELSQHSDIATFLSHQLGSVRVEVNDKDIAYNFGDWYGIDHFGGYLASLTENVNRVQGDTRARSMYGINFSVSRTPMHPNQVEVFAGRSGVKVYENPGAFPRAWSVHSVSAIQNDQQVGAALNAAAFDPSRQTFVAGSTPQLEVCSGPDTVALVSRPPSMVLLEANLKCRGMVIDADTFFPGWVATVDGKPSQLYEAYGFLRGVVVDAGPHRIEMRYRPKSVYWGAALTALGFMAACALAAVEWK
jgi:hypothetical protein